MNRQVMVVTKTESFVVREPSSYKDVPVKVAEAVTEAMSTAEATCGRIVAMRVIINPDCFR